MKPQAEIRDEAKAPEGAMAAALPRGRGHGQMGLMNEPDPTLRLRLVFSPGGMLGPGKAELLERIARTGSIAAAGREMGMSYKRAWQLVETLNAMFADPLVSSSRGGAGGGGASVTEAGLAVLAAYRGFEAAAREAGRDHAETLRAMLRAPAANAAGVARCEDGTCEEADL